MSRNFKTLIYTILNSWTDEDIVESRLGSLHIRGSPYVEASQHPALLHQLKDQMIHQHPVPYHPVYYAIRKELERKLPSTAGYNYINVANFWLNVGKKCIFPDTADGFCQRLPSTLIVSESLGCTQTTEIHGGVVTVRVLDANTTMNTITKSQTVDPSSKTVYLTHQKRIRSNATTGHYKGLALAQFLSKLSPEYILMLGDGGGGYTWAFLVLMANLTIYFNTLTDPSRAIEQLDPIPYLPSMAGWPELESRIRGMHLNNEGVADFTEPTFLSQCKNKILHNIDGIVCDAETPDYLVGAKPFVLADSIAKIAEVLKVKWVCMKSYCLNPTALRLQISRLLCSFQKVEILRCLFSDSNNTEIFLFAHTRTSTGVLGYHAPFFRGHQLPETYESLLSAKGLSLRDIKDPSTDLMWYYSSLSTKNEPEGLERQFLSEIPIFHGDTFVYPHNVRTWIRSTSSLFTGLPRTFNRHLETSYISPHTLIRWISAYLIGWGYAFTPSEQEFHDMFYHGCFIWFRQRNRAWDLSLSLEYPPWSLQGDGVLVWKINTVLKTSHLKLIQRYIGIASLTKHIL